MAQANVSRIPTVELDDTFISGWITARLNEARDGFVNHMRNDTPLGRTYRRGGRIHVASAPGQYPANDYGYLASIITTGMEGPHSGYIEADVDYAGYLTTGTQFMAPRKMLPDILEEVVNEHSEDELARAVVIR